MSVGSAIGKGKGIPAIAVSVSKPDEHDAMSEFLRAVEAKDTKGMAAAFSMAYQACKDKEEEYTKGSGKEPDGDEGY